MVNGREHLRALIERLCLLEGDFTLSTGQKSDYYFDCKCATLDGEALQLIAQAFLDEIAHFQVQPVAIGGLTMGADFMTAATIVLSHQQRRPLKKGSIVRKEPKAHGTRRMVENELERGTSIVVVDDVVTTGRSTLLACDEFQMAGYNIVGILAIVDREVGGLARLKERCSNVTALFCTSDFPRLASKVQRTAAVAA